jgi:hypothetical protein
MTKFKLKPVPIINKLILATDDDNGRERVNISSLNLNNNHDQGREQSKYIGKRIRNTSSLSIYALTIMNAAETSSPAKKTISNAIRCTLQKARKWELIKRIRSGSSAKG